MRVPKTHLHYNKETIKYEKPRSRLIGEDSKSTKHCLYFLEFNIRVYKLICDGHIEIYYSNTGLRLQFSSYESTHNSTTE